MYMAEQDSKFLNYQKKEVKNIIAEHGGDLNSIIDINLCKGVINKLLVISKEDQE